MPGVDTSLRDTVRTAMGETKETAKADAGHQEELSKGNSGETNTGETAEKEYVEGVDISDIPVEQRPLIKAKLEEKAKLLKKGYDTKYQEVAKFKKAQDELINMGLTVEEAQNVLVKHIEEKRNPNKTIEQKKEATRLLDKLMDGVPKEQREYLEQLRQIVLEETNVSKLMADIEELKKAIGHYQFRDRELGREQVNKDLTTLSEKFGDDVISKYQEDIVKEWERHPNIKTKDILKYVIPDDEYEQALIAKGRKTLTPEKKNAISSSRSGVSGTLENVDVKKETTKSLIQKLISK